MSIATLFRSVTDASAIVSFDAPAPVSVAFATSSTPPDYQVGANVVGNGSGNWISVWYGNLSGILDIQISRSSDDGRTWTLPEALEQIAGTDTHPVIATDRVGVWLTVWGNLAQDTLLVARSTDNGATWSPASAPDDGGGTTTLLFPAVVTDEAGVWIIAGQDPFDRVHVIRSTDNGVTWEPTQRLDTDDPADIHADHEIEVATDESGNWVAFWTRDGTQVAAQSTDNGQTWSGPIVVGDVGEAIAEGGSIATDGLGHWVTVWSWTPEFFTEYDLVYSVSTDNGATWTAQAPLSPTSAGDRGVDLIPSVTAGSDGTFYATWFMVDGDITGKDSDIFMSRSTDGGATWSGPTTINLLARKDGSAEEFEEYLGHDGDKGWVAMWPSDNSLGGTIGTDFDIFYATARDDCPTTPSPGCKKPTRPGASKISIKDSSRAADKLRWKWSAGEETLPADVGDPTVSSSYALCVYAKSGASVRSVFEADAKGGANCSGQPCWKTKSSGYAYGDKAHEHGAVSSLSVGAGPEGKAKMKVTATGPSLGPPALPLEVDPEVTVQLLNTDTGACWEATYSTTVTNETTRFTARSD